MKFCIETTVKNRQSILESKGNKNLTANYRMNANVPKMHVSPKANEEMYSDEEGKISVPLAIENRFIIL